MKLLDGKKCAQALIATLEKEVASFPRKVGLAFILVGHDEASKIYVRMKQKACAKVGIESTVIQCDESISQQALIDTIKEHNDNPNIHGILVQQPLPAHINTHQIVSAVDPSKDVDGFHPVNLGKLVCQDPSGFIPCTPLGITKLLAYYNLSLEGKQVAIVGRSLIVGSPLSILLSQKREGLNATVTLLHTGSKNIASQLINADVIVACAGSKHLIQKEHVKQGAIVIDVGIHRETIEGHSCRVVGDVDFNSVQSQCSAITPVPGGIGPMTIACLLYNTISNFKTNR